MKQRIIEDTCFPLHPGSFFSSKFEKKSSRLFTLEKSEVQISRVFRAKSLSYRITMVTMNKQ